MYHSYNVTASQFKVQCIIVLFSVHHNVCVTESQISVSHQNLRHHTVTISDSAVVIQKIILVYI